MAQLPRVSGRQAVKAFEGVGYQVVRQRGSHVRLKHATSERMPLTVPEHRELKSDLLPRLIRHTGMTVEEFTALVDAV